MVAEVLAVEKGGANAGGGSGGSISGGSGERKEE